mmetsp:Transcript_17565/g.37093  ORF Transcript_17565/g.37093 Transcript_17565/m.37093 type:complete len:160 (+) Transcript_17565:1818-2297(+)
MESLSLTEVPVDVETNGTELVGTNPELDNMGLLSVLCADWGAENNREVLAAELMDIALELNPVLKLETSSPEERPDQVVDFELIGKGLVLRALNTLVLEIANELEKPLDSELVCDIALVKLLLFTGDVAACASKAMYSSCVSCPSSNPLDGAWGGSGGR